MLLGGRLLSRSLRLPYLASASLLALLVPLVAGRANETHPAGARSPLALRPPGARPARPAGRLRLVCGWFVGGLWVVCGWFVGGLWGGLCRRDSTERSPEIARDRPRSPETHQSASPGFGFVRLFRNGVALRSLASVSALHTTSMAMGDTWQVIYIEPLVHPSLCIYIEPLVHPSLCSSMHASRDTRRRHLPAIGPFTHSSSPKDTSQVFARALRGWIEFIDE